MPKTFKIEELLKNGSTEWNRQRKAGTVSTDHTGATFENLFSANTDLSGLVLVGTEWDRCDLSKVSFRDTDLSNAYFHGGRLQDCDFRGAGAGFARAGRRGHGPGPRAGRGRGAAAPAAACARDDLLHPRAAAGD